MTNKWFNLDNSANLYALINSNGSQSIFRFTVELTDNIIADKMQDAINLTLERFPSFKVRLRRGVWWHYLEHNDKQLKLRPESDILMDTITAHNCDDYCFRIMYYNNRLSFEFFHALCDGNGALAFIKSVLYTYFKTLGLEVDAEGKVITYDSPINPEEYEDSFGKNFKPIKLKDLNLGGMVGTTNPAFVIPGKQFKHLGKGAITADLDIKQLLAYCKSKGWTISHFLGGLFMYSVYMTKVKQVKKPRDITLFIPINLRKMYGSITLRNFILFSRARADVKKDDLTLEDFVQIVQNAIASCYTKEYMDTNISTAMMGEKFWAMRFAPLFVKQFLFEANNHLNIMYPTKTSTFSNMGMADLPKSFEPYVKKITFLLNAYPSIPMAFTAISTFDTLTLGFVRLLRDTEIEKFFIKYLADLGFDISVDSNYWEVDNEPK